MDKNQNITTDQKEVLSMIKEDFLTVKQIATARQTSTQAIYKIIKKLRTKGLLSKGLQKGLQKPRPLQPPKSVRAGMVRLHGQHWRLKLLLDTEHSSKYLRIRRGGNILNIDGNTVELNAESIEVYSSTQGDSDPLHGFFADDVLRATALSFDYWNRFFYRLESELGVVLMKARSNNKSLVHKGHYAEVQNELAKEYNEKKVKLTVYGTGDGRAWFKIDNSLNLNEAETVHPQRSPGDLERVKDFFNEIRDGQPLQSEVMQMILEQQKMARETQSIIKENAVGMSALIKILQKNNGGED